MLIDEIFVETAKKIPDHKFIIDSEQELTFDDVLVLSSNISSYLLEKQVPTGSHIALWFDNSAHFITSLLGILRAGCVAVPVYYHSKPIEINFILNSTDTSYYLSDGEIPSISLSKFKWISYKDIIETNKIFDNSLIVRKKSDLAFILATSGSTGRPKNVMLSHENIICSAVGHQERTKYNNSDVMLVTMPASFSSTLSTQIVLSMITGTTLIMPKIPVLPRLVPKFIKNYKVTCMAVVPSMLKNIIKSIVKSEDSIRMITISSSTCSESLLNDTKKIFPQASILHTYGLTEAAPRVSIMEPSDTYLSCGRPVSGVEIKVVNEDNEAQGINNLGEVCVRGRNVMLGYYKDTELTQQVITNNWLKTGDVGYQDQEGRLHLVGRIKNIINVGGQNVYPEEVEMVIGQLMDVIRVLVTSKTDELYGEVPIAYIEIMPGSSLTERILFDHTVKQLSNYKIPKEWILVDTLPITATEKVIRIDQNK